MRSCSQLTASSLRCHGESTAPLRRWNRVARERLQVAYYPLLWSPFCMSVQVHNCWHQIHHRPGWECIERVSPPPPFNHRQPLSTPPPITLHLKCLNIVTCTFGVRFIWFSFCTWCLYIYFLFYLYISTVDHLCTAFLIFNWWYTASLPPLVRRKTTCRRHSACSLCAMTTRTGTR